MERSMAGLSMRGERRRISRLDFQVAQAQRMLVARISGIARVTSDTNFMQGPHSFRTLCSMLNGNGIECGTDFR